MSKTIVVKIPMKIPSEANLRTHWTAATKRHKQQKILVKLALMEHDLKDILPCNIQLIRFSPRKLDFDNLVSAMKWIRDAVADQIIPGLRPGRADDDERLIWQYFQQPSKTQELMIVIRKNP